MKLIATSTLSLLVALAALAAGPERPFPEDSTQDAALACITMNTERLPLDSRRSPLDSVSFTVQDNAVKICYGRPSARGREVMDSLLPYGELWRTGANEPTMIHSTIALEIAGIRIEAGTYALYTVPGESEWELIVNASISQWGHERYYDDELKRQEVGRSKVRSGRTDEYVESFMIRAQPAEGGNATVYLEWEETRVEIPISNAG